MPSWMKHKLESRFPGEISITSDMQIKPPMAESEEELRSLLMKLKGKNEKAGLKFNIHKTKILTSYPITSWQTDGGNNRNRERLFSWAPKSLLTVTAALKLKDACSLEEKL